ncbi:head-tail adaptor protein [uncultured Pseudacidovorax sp.]|uniref:phage head completion protein n=1 Tax=uncultured Pseudacidovorax sp. TaxID=679313 RepID=UPI0025E71C17|nr:head-tail adaptor protein [uncultured Pseudacidovorax sp.]
MKAPYIGELTMRVRIRPWQDEPDDGTSIDPVYGEGFEVWARLKPVGAMLYYGTAQVQAGITHRLVTWRTARVNAQAITAAFVVEHRGLRYRVKRATEVDESTEVWVLLDLEQLGTVNP